MIPLQSAPLFIAISFPTWMHEGRSQSGKPILINCCAHSMLCIQLAKTKQNKGGHLWRPSVNKVGGTGAPAISLCVYEMRRYMLKKYCTNPFTIQLFSCYVSTIYFLTAALIKWICDEGATHLKILWFWPMTSWLPTRMLSLFARDSATFARFVSVMKPVVFTRDSTTTSASQPCALSTVRIYSRHGTHDINWHLSPLSWHSRALCSAYTH